MRQQGRLNGVAVATRQVPNVLGRSRVTFLSLLNLLEGEIGELVSHDLILVRESTKRNQVSIRAVLGALDSVKLQIEPDILPSSRQMMAKKVQMTRDQREIHRKKRVLEYAERIGNINKTCRYFGVARSSFYEWRDRFREFGDEGLKS